ncbi:MAG TPA: response regulator [Pyrinomonadaceae bacterium]|nr:response regulator [Pyrinomonadaceae bacterium]
MSSVTVAKQMRHKALFLVVEDFEDSRFMMRQLLEMAGHKVVEATDGEQAVKVALEKKPAIILMDLSLPKLDGLAATREIRRHKGLRNVPILAVSAHDGDESRAAALEAGCDDYVTKPIDFDQLNTLVRHYLSKSH